MADIIRNVRDIERDDRQVLEHVLGEKLRENQQVIFHVVTLDKESADKHALCMSGLPDWCNVFDGLGDDQVADIDSVIRQRADLTRRAK